MGGAGLFIPATASLSWGQRVWADLLEPETQKKHRPLPLHMTCLAFPALPHPSRTPRVKEAVPPLQLAVFKVLRGRCADAAFNSRVLPRAGARFPPARRRRKLQGTLPKTCFGNFSCLLGPLNLKIIYLDKPKPSKTTISYFRDLGPFCGFLILDRYGTCPVHIFQALAAQTVHETTDNNVQLFCGVLNPSS